MYSQDKVCHQTLSHCQLATAYTSFAEMRQFLGLASYYRLILLTLLRWQHLASANSAFIWSADCVNAFNNLKNQLSTAPILSFPQFDSNADIFHYNTDASSVGLGAVLEQCGKVIAYASRSLTPAERQYIAQYKRSVLLLSMPLSSFVITSWAGILICLQTTHYSSG